MYNVDILNLEVLVHVVVEGFTYADHFETFRYLAMLISLGTIQAEKPSSMKTTSSPRPYTKFRLVFFRRDIWPWGRGWYEEALNTPLKLYINCVELDTVSPTASLLLRCTKMLEMPRHTSWKVDVHNVVSV